MSQNTLVKSLIAVVIFGMTYQSHADECHIDVGNKYVQIFDKIAQVPNDTQVKYTEYRHYQSETNKQVIVNYQGVDITLSAHRNFSLMSPAHRLNVDDALKYNLYEIHALTNLGDNAYLAKLGCSDNQCLYHILGGDGELFAHYIADDKNAYLGRTFLSSLMSFDNKKHGQCIISPYNNYNYNYMTDFITVYYSDNHLVPDNPAKLSADMVNLLGAHQKPLNGKKLGVYIEIHADSSDIDTPARADEYQALSQQRADHLKAQLQQNGIIDPDLIKVIYEGATRPLAPSDSEHHRRLNRRVVIYVAYR